MLTYSRHPALLNRDDSVLVVVDMQEPFLSVMHGRDALVAHVVLLICAARVLQIPVLTTVQYAERMGGVIAAVTDAMSYPPTNPEESTALAIDKLCFSCAGSEEFLAALTATNKKQVLVCGVETHICVSQTAHDLLHAGFHVNVAADAVSSRTLEKHKLGMERIRDAEIKPCAAESAVYEWLYKAGTPEFKEILKLVK